MEFIFFILFVIAVIIGGSVTIGGFSVRVYLTVLMILYLLIVRKRKIKESRIDMRYIIVFLMFILYLPIALLRNNGFSTFDYFHIVVAYYLVAIVAFFAVDRFVNNKGDISRLILGISLVVLMNSVVTILQFHGSSIGWVIGGIFADISDTSDVFMANDGALNLSVLPGIMGGVVGNGFLLAVCSPLLIPNIIGKTRIIKRLYYIAVLVLAVIACFYTQQRAAFYLLLVSIAFYLIRGFLSPKGIIAYIAVLVVLFVVYNMVPIDFSSEVIGRLADRESEDRVALYHAAAIALNGHLFFGNPVDYYRMTSVSVHNVLLDSLITSGIIGALIMSVLYFKTVIKSVSLMLESRVIVSEYTKAAALSVFVAMILGLFHNSSFYTGDVLVFITLALMLKSEIIEKKLEVSYENTILFSRTGRSDVSMAENALH